MASKGRDLFFTPSEFVAWMEQDVSALELQVWLSCPGWEHLVEWRVGEELNPDVVIGFFIERSRGLKSFGSKSVNAPLLGMVAIEPPTVSGNFLFLARLHARTDWWDDDTQETHDNPHSLTVFDAIWRRWRPRVRNKVYVDHMGDGAGGVVNRIYYSPGALVWQRAGGVLRDKYARNLNYKIVEAANEPI